jgi:hypothetical protein
MGKLWLPIGIGVRSYFKLKTNRLALDEVSSNLRLRNRSTGSQSIVFLMPVNL